MTIGKNIARAVKTKKPALVLNNEQNDKNLAEPRKDDIYNIGCALLRTMMPISKIISHLDLARLMFGILFPTISLRKKVDKCFVTLGLEKTLCPNH